MTATAPRRRLAAFLLLLGVIVHTVPAVATSPQVRRERATEDRNVFQGIWTEVLTLEADCPPDAEGAGTYVVTVQAQVKIGHLQGADDRMSLCLTSSSRSETCDRSRSASYAKLEVDGKEEAIETIATVTLRHVEETDYCHEGEVFRLFAQMEKNHGGADQILAERAWNRTEISAIFLPR